MLCLLFAVDDVFFGSQSIKATPMNVELLNQNSPAQLSSDIGDVFRANAHKILQTHGFTVKDLISAIEKNADGKVASRTISGYLSRAESAKRNPTISTLQTMVAGFNALGVCVDESDLLKRGDLSTSDSINIDSFVTSVKSALTVGMKVNASIEDMVLAGLVNYVKSLNSAMDDMALAENIFSARQALHSKPELSKDAGAPSESLQKSIKKSR